MDDEGVVHDCCCYSHAMEYQRRLSLQKQGTYNIIILWQIIHTNIGIGVNIVKGITHCLLSECDNLTWPFENYCGKTHASIGMDRGLSSKNSNYY